MLQTVSKWCQSNWEQLLGLCAIIFTQGCQVNMPCWLYKTPNTRRYKSFWRKSDFIVLTSFVWWPYGQYVCQAGRQMSQHSVIWLAFWVQDDFFWFISVSEPWSPRTCFSSESSLYTTRVTRPLHSKSLYRLYYCNTVEKTAEECMIYTEYQCTVPQHFSE